MPKVSIIVTAFLEASKPYLDLCIRSINNLNYPDFETIIVSPRWYKPEYEGFRTVHPTRTDFPNAHALNFGAENADPKSEYFFFINDDVILTKNSLSALVQSAREVENTGIFMPIGNDQQGRYMWPVPWLPVGPWRIDQIKGHEETLMNAESPYRCGMMFHKDLCLYAVLIPRKVYEVVGGFDEGGWKDDIDYCWRVAKLGRVNAICMNSLVYHSMGPSTSVTLGALDSQTRIDDEKRFNEKWERIDGAP